MDSLYFLLLSNSFLANVMLMGRSENVLYAMTAFGGHNLLGAGVAAVFAGALAHLVNYFIGYYFSSLKDKNWFVLDHEQYAVASRLVSRYGVWLLLLGMLPVYAALPVIMGFCRVPLVRVLPLVAGGLVVLHVIEIMRINTFMGQ